MKGLITSYLEDLKDVMTCMPLDRIEEVIKAILDAYRRKSTIFIFGNGGSAATASHFACDINKGACSLLKKRFKVACLNDSIPTIMAYANDNSYSDIFVEQLKNFLSPSDLVIGISASGNSKNVLKAFKYARKTGAQTVGLSGFNGGALARLADLSVVIKVKDMQKIEDAHLVIAHIIMQAACKQLNAK